MRNLNAIAKNWIFYPQSIISRHLVGPNVIILHEFNNTALKKVIFFLR